MNILIAHDGSIHAGIAIDDLHWAGLPANAQAIVFSVVEDVIPTPRSIGGVETRFSGEPDATAERLAEEACNRLQSYFPTWDIQIETRWGNPATVILEKAKSWPADLIVVGTHGRSKLARVLLGSVSLRLVREAPCTVRVGRAGKHDGPIRLLIGNDGSVEAEATLDEVCARSWPAGTEARVFSVLEVLSPVTIDPIAIHADRVAELNENERQRLKNVSEESVRKLRHAGLVVSTAIEEGDPKQALLQEALKWKADTVFVGARGVGRIERLLLGSVSSAAVAQAPYTVEVVRKQ